MDEGGRLEAARCASRCEAQSNSACADRHLRLPANALELLEDRQWIVAEMVAHEQRRLRQYIQGDEAVRRTARVQLAYLWEGMADGSENIALPANGYFYDELPLRVRTIDFSKPNGEFSIQLAPTMINSKKEAIVFKPAKISFASTEKTIEVDLQHAGGKDHFVLDREFPFLFREWNAADGSHLKLKRSLKIDYWNYNKPGDRERALKDPALRHPD